MSPNELVFFGVTLFLALAVFIKWRHSRDLVARRMNRGLRGYVSGQPPVPDSRGGEEELIVA